MTRKHRATGKKPPGGARPGAGRPPGTKNTLPLGAVAALKAAGLRVPPAASEAEKALADRALQRIADVLEEKVWHTSAGHVLKAAQTIREEVCGPVKQRVEHSFSDMSDEQFEAEKARLQAKWAVSGTPPPTSGSES